MTNGKTPYIARSFDNDAVHEMLFRNLEISSSLLAPVANFVKCEADTSVYDNSWRTSFARQEPKDTVQMLTKIANHHQAGQNPDIDEVPFI